jgi:hypothetical protein
VSEMCCAPVPFMENENLVCCGWVFCSIIRAACVMSGMCYAPEPAIEHKFIEKTKVMGDFTALVCKDIWIHRHVDKYVSSSSGA